MKEELGPFGLPYSHVGQVVQALLVCIEERGYSREDIVDALPKLDETSLWDELGPVIDRLESELFDAEREHMIGCEPEGNCECEP